MQQRPKVFLDKVIDVQDLANLQPGDSLERIESRDEDSISVKVQCHRAS